MGINQFFQNKGHIYGPNDMGVDPQTGRTDREQDIWDAEEVAKRDLFEAKRASERDAADKVRRSRDLEETKAAEDRKHKMLELDKEKADAQKTVDDYQKEKQAKIDKLNAERRSMEMFEEQQKISQGLRAEDEKRKAEQKALEEKANYERLMGGVNQGADTNDPQLARRMGVPIPPGPGDDLGHQTYKLPAHVPRAVLNQIAASNGGVVPPGIIATEDYMNAQADVEDKELQMRDRWKQFEQDNEKKRQDEAARSAQKASEALQARRSEADKAYMARDAAAAKAAAIESDASEEGLKKQGKGEGKIARQEAAAADRRAKDITGESSARKVAAAAGIDQSIFDSTEESQYDRDIKADAIKAAAKAKGLDPNSKEGQYVYEYLAYLKGR